MLGFDNSIYDQMIKEDRKDLRHSRKRFNQEFLIRSTDSTHKTDLMMRSYLVSPEYRKACKAIDGRLLDFKFTTDEDFMVFIEKLEEK